MNNHIKEQRRKLSDILSIKSHPDFHDYLLCEAIDRYKRHRQAYDKNIGSVLAICLNFREAITLKQYGFNEILLTGITESPSEVIKEIKDDPRIKATIQRIFYKQR